MKISELSTDKAIDSLCQLVPYIDSIATDEKVMTELMSGIDITDADTPLGRFALISKKLVKLIPLILKDHKSEVFEIVATLNDKSVEDVEHQSLIKTMSEIKELVKDKELIDFFKSCTNAEGGE